jgi:hypothetical protein
MLRMAIRKIDITPSLGVRLGGYGQAERPGEAVHDPLAATAMVLMQEERLAAHVTLDVCIMQTEDVERTRHAAARSSGIPAERINIGVSHTHSAPQTFSMPGWGEKDEGYLHDLIQKVATVVAEARGACVPVRVGYATLPTEVGVNRRWVGSGHEPSFGANEGGPYDATMTVARFESESGPVGALIHCSAHCTAMGNNRLISRDWAGVMVDRVESQINVPVLFINGAFGDAGPRTNALTPQGVFKAGGGDGIHSVNECGYRAAGDGLRAYQSIKHFEDSPVLRILSGTIQIPLAPLPALEAARAKLAEYAPQKEEWGAGMCNYDYWRRVIAAHDLPAKAHLDFPQTVIALGPMALVPMPGEPFSSTSLRIRALSPFQHTLVCGGTNGCLSYLPDCEARARGGYEAWVGISVLTQLLADHSDDTLVNANVALLQQMRGA